MVGALSEGAVLVHGADPDLFAKVAVEWAEALVVAVNGAGREGRVDQDLEDDLRFTGSQATKGMTEYPLM